MQDEAGWRCIVKACLQGIKVVDVMKNSQGEAFVDFLRGVMTVVNGRKGRDAFPCVSEKGCSVVDYCIVGCDDFELVENFAVTTMSESVEKMGCRGVVTRVPDHSFLRWEVLLDGVTEVKEKES